MTQTRLPEVKQSNDSALSGQKAVAEFILNIIKGHTKEVLDTNQEIPEHSRVSIKDALKRIPGIFDGLATALEPLRAADQSSLASAYASIGQLMLATATLGMSLEYSPEAKDHILALVAKKARDASAAKAIKSIVDLAPVVQKVCAARHRPLAASKECARQIRPDVLAALKLAKNAKQPGLTKIQKALSAAKKIDSGLS